MLSYKRLNIILNICAAKYVKTSVKAQNDKENDNSIKKIVPTNWIWSASLVLIGKQTPNNIDIVTLVKDGSTYFTSTIQNF